MSSDKPAGIGGCALRTGVGVGAASSNRIELVLEYGRQWLNPTRLMPVAAVGCSTTVVAVCGSATRRSPRYMGA
jgi:hypothetical protein